MPQGPPPGIRKGKGKGTRTRAALLGCGKGGTGKGKGKGKGTGRGRAGTGGLSWTHFQLAQLPGCQTSKRDATALAVEAYYASQRAFEDEQLATQTTRLWEIVHIESTHVYEAPTGTSKYLDTKPVHSTVHGQQVGEWLALSGGLGYIRMRTMVETVLLRLMKDLVITVHIGPLDLTGFAQVLCTLMSGEELTEVRISRDDRVSDLRARIEEEVFDLGGDFNMMTPGGLVLSDDSLSIGDVLGDDWMEGVGEGDLQVQQVQEFMI